MITSTQLSELFVEGMPSLRFSRPSLAAEWSEWRVCVAQHFIEIKKSGPASESHISYLLLERLFVDGDEEVRLEAQLLLEAVMAEGRKANLPEATLSKEFGLETRHALERPISKVEIPTQIRSQSVFLSPVWGPIGVVLGFTSWLPILIIRLLGIDNHWINGSAWVLAGLGLAFGIRYGYGKKS